MKKILCIKRQENSESRPYREEYEIDPGDSNVTIAAALRLLSEENRIYAERDIPYRALVWECSCLQRKCGACAMVVDNVPCLACGRRVGDSRGERIVIEPLRKFPLICDLMVDRSIMDEMLYEHEVWLKGRAKEKNDDIAFEASKCIKCGLCLEICPNWNLEGSFGGMAAMTSFARLMAKEPEEQLRERASHYKTAVYNGCGKSLACRDICPASVDIEKLLVKSNAAAIWKRRM